MITAVQSYNTNFNGLKNLKSQKIARQVVKMENHTPKGLSKISRSELDDDTIKYLLFGAGTLLGSTTAAPGLTAVATNEDAKDALMVIGLAAAACAFFSNESGSFND